MGMPKSYNDLKSNYNGVLDEQDNLYICYQIQ